MKMHLTTWLAGLALLLPVSASTTAVAQTDDQGASSSLSDLSLRPNRRTPSVGNRPVGDGAPPTATTANTEAAAVNSDTASADDEKNRQTNLLGIALVKSNEGHAVAEKVRPKSPAWNAGVRQGDHVKSIEGVPSQPYETFIKAARDIVIDKKKGEEIRLVVMRDDKKKTFTIDARGNGEILSEGAKQARDIQKVLDANPEDTYMPAKPGGASLSEEGTAVDDSLSSGSAAVGAGAIGTDGGLTADERFRGAIRTRGGYVDPDNGFYDGGLIDPTPNNGVNGNFGNTTNQEGLLEGQSANDRVSDARAADDGVLDRTSMPRQGEGLSNRQRQRFEQLQQQAQVPDGLNEQEERELRSLASRENRMTRFGQQLRDLEARQARGELSPQQEARLTHMRQRADSVRQQSNMRSRQSQLLSPTIADAIGDQQGNLLSRQQQRQFERLSNRTQLSAQEQSELNQLRQTANRRAAQNLQQEFNTLSQSARTGQTLNNAQQARLRQLQQTRRAISQSRMRNQAANQAGLRGARSNRSNFGPNRPQATGTAPDNNAVPPALQGQSNPVGAGSGIGTGSSPNAGSGIGTASGGAGGGATGGASVGSGE